MRNAATNQSPPAWKDPLVSSLKSSSRTSGSRQSLHRALVLVALAVFSVAFQPQPITAVAAATSQGVWSRATVTNNKTSSSSRSVELGMKFSSSVAGLVTGVRFYKGKNSTGTHRAALWTAGGKRLATATFRSETATGWQTVTFAKPVAIAAGKMYVASYYAPKGHYAYTRAGYASAREVGVLSAPVNAGVYRHNSRGFPKKSYKSTNYWVDVIFEHTPASTPSPPVPVPTPSGSPGVTAPPTATASATVRPTTAPPTTAPPTTAPPTTAPPTTTPPTTAPPTTAPPTAPGSTNLNCIAKPSACGYPDASNTGVTAGITLKRVPQDITSGTGWAWDSRGWINAGSGAVVEGLDFNGSVEVTGSNVVVRNNRLTASGEGWAVALRHAANATIQNNDLVPSGTRLMVGIKDIYGDSSNTRIIGNDISNASTGVQISQGLIEANYIHDLGMVSGDHVNGTTSNGGTSQLTIRGNTVLNRFSQTDAISLFQDFGLEANRLITGNLVAGGGYTIYGGDNRNFGRTYNIKITNNRFSTIYFPNSGYYGPYAAYDPAGSGNEFSGNVWDNTGQPVR